MSLKKSFMDNEVYGADDINFALSRLTTQGVSLFNYTGENDNPLVSLNDAVAAMASPGVEMYNTDSCKVAYDSSTEKFSVAVGTAFMPDGSLITVEDNAEDITDIIAEARESSTGTLNVFFYRNIQDNTIEIKAQDKETALDNEKTVLLAEVSADNNVMDMRTFSRTKIAPASGNIIQTIEVPYYKLRASDTNEMHMRKEFENVFHGASYCFYNGALVPIQKIDTTDGTELTYVICTQADPDDSRCYAAFNMKGTTLQLWLYTTTSYINAQACNAYVF